jgi:hypothetical protein
MHPVHNKHKGGPKPHKFEELEDTSRLMFWSSCCTFPIKLVVLFRKPARKNELFCVQVYPRDYVNRWRGRLHSWRGHPGGDIPVWPKGLKCARHQRRNRHVRIVSLNSKPKCSFSRRGKIPGIPPGISRVYFQYICFIYFQNAAFISNIYRVAWYFATNLFWCLYL